MLFDAMPRSEEGENSALHRSGLGLTWLAVVLFFPSYFLKIKGGVVLLFFCCLFCFVSFPPPTATKKKKGKNARVCVSEREKNPQGK